MGWGGRGCRCTDVLRLGLVTVVVFALAVSTASCGDDAPHLDQGNPVPRHPREPGGEHLG